MRKMRGCSEVYLIKVCAQHQRSIFFVPLFLSTSESSRVVSPVVITSSIIAIWLAMIGLTNSKQFLMFFLRSDELRDDWAAVCFFRIQLDLFILMFSALLTDLAISRAWLKPLSLNRFLCSGTGIISVGIGIF